MIRYLVITEDDSLVHFINAGQKDLTLCGLGMVSESTQSVRKANCKHCINIVLHCKKIKTNEYVPPTL
jgi:hypothetical protein